jgi:hypothetical protein
MGVAEAAAPSHIEESSGGNSATRARISAKVAAGFGMVDPMEFVGNYPDRWQTRKMRTHRRWYGSNAPYKLDHPLVTRQGATLHCGKIKVPQGSSM